MKNRNFCPLRRTLATAGTVLLALVVSTGTGRAGGQDIPALWPTGALTADDAVHVNDAEFMPAEQLRAWNDELDQVGPPNQKGLRSTGSPAHEAYISKLRGDLRLAGVKKVHQEKVPMTRWTASDWSLQIVDGPDAGSVRTASYIPYSGQTDAAGVAGPLVYVAPGSTPATGSLTGKIALVDVPLTIVPYAFFTAFGYDDRLYDPASTLNPSDPYKRPYLNEVIRMLTAVANAGAVGVVAILDYPGDGADGSYFPYDGILRHVPGLYVDRATGAVLKTQALAGRSVRLTLQATVDATSTRNIVGYIPGRSKEIVVLHSHTDGTNGLEDNGPYSIVAIAQYLARLPEGALDRSVMIFLSTGHFAGGNGIRAFREKHARGLIRRINAAVTIEHLGALEWEELPGETMGATGRHEAGAFFSPGSTPLVDSAYQALVRADAGPGGVLKPINPTASGFPDSTWPGEGQYLFARRGIQTANYITGPTYLLNWGISTSDRIDFDRVRDLAIGFTEQVLTLTRTPREGLVTNDLCMFLFCDKSSTSTGTDVATASAAGTTLEAAVDGDVETSFRSGNPLTTSDWVMVDRGESKVLTAVDLYMGSPAFPTERIEDGTIESSEDGLTWTAIGPFSGTDEVHMDVPGRTARYVRVRPSSDQAGRLVVREFAVDRQLASSGVPSASGYSVGSMTDSDSAVTYWRTSRAPLASDEVRLDLGRAVDVTTVELKMSHDSFPGSRIEQGILEASLDGTAWVAVGSFAGTDDVRVTAASPTTARYVRVRPTADQTSALVVREFSAIVAPLQPSSGPGGSDYAHGDWQVTSGGTGVNAWYVFEPTSPKPASAPVAVLMHGYGEYQGYDSMYELIRHTVRKGNVVIYPRWQTDTTLPCAGSTNIEPCVDSATAGIQGALAFLQANPTHVQPQLAKASYFGFSFGGILTADLANRHQFLGLPEPKAIFLDDPHDGGFAGGGEPGLDDSLAGIPATTKVQCHVGANGVTGEPGKENDSCNALFPLLGHIPSSNKDLVLSYTDAHGDGDLLSEHGVCVSKPGAVDAYDWNFVWKVWDAMRSWAYDGTDSEYVHGDTIEHRSMGYWSDGRAITPLKIQDSAPILP